MIVTRKDKTILGTASSNRWGSLTWRSNELGNRRHSVASHLKGNPIHVRLDKKDYAWTDYRHGFVGSKG